MERLHDIGEFGMLDSLRGILSRHSQGLDLGIGDDVAIMSPFLHDDRMVWTMDTMVEGTHFRPWSGVSFRRLGHKLAATNLSDLASKGARPLAALLSLGAPGDTPVASIQDLYAGLDESLDREGVHLIGGDTVRAPVLVLTLALVGLLPRNCRIAARRTAHVGHKVFMTGFPGEASAGLWVLEHGTSADREAYHELVNRQIDPTPRLREGKALVTRVPDLAMIDVSDGVLSDSWQISRASGTRIVLSQQRLPVSSRLYKFCGEKALPALDFILKGGEDYELLFTTGMSEAELREFFRDRRIPTLVTEIGEVERGTGVALLRSDGTLQEFPPGGGFAHFALPETPAP